MQTKKFIFSLLVLLGICGSMTAQNNYKVLEVHKDGKVTHTLKLSDIDSLTVKTVETDTTVISPVEPGVHEYVDLGLPSGTLWATTNVGAALPADCGNYYSWGEISLKNTYDWNTYKWCNGSSYNTLTKYNTDSFYGSIVDQKLVLETSDDVATADWGSEWCMPTAEEMKELADSNNCTWTWTKRTNSKGEAVNGYEVKSNANGNSIFLPTTGYCNDASSYKTDTEGCYWSLSIHSDDGAVYPYYAHYLNFTPDYHDANSGYYRYYGLSVRPVRASGNTPDQPDQPDTPDNPELPDTTSTHTYVDLGLPSGTLWATTNIGAASPAEYGDYFAWGETTPKTTYDWNTYEWGESYNKLSKYNTESLQGPVDNKTILDAEDDAATVNWGCDWCTPTVEALEELLDTTYCTWTWTQQTNPAGVRHSGYEVKSKLNGNSIFLPAAGRSHSPSIGSGGCYWSSSLDVEGPNRACYLIFNSSNNQGWNYMGRESGMPIRPIRATSHTPELPDTPVDPDQPDTPDTPEFPDTTSTHTYVDLGLPGGTLWATTNVGASSPTEYGDYFAWGETRTKDSYGWENYKWSNDGTNSTLTKYNLSTSYGAVDNKTVLEAEDDAATANWGSDWRMPTQEEIDQLRKYCTWTWTTLNGVNGYSVVGPNGNSIFLPAAGTHLDAVVETDEWGYYWSSSLLSSTSSLASCLYFYSTKYSADNFDRASGRTIRPVRAEVKQEKHEYIDLGLPSGTLWANMNVGAASPADFGDYFSWGETAPKDSYDWGDYKHSFSNSKIYKYNTSSTYGEVDSLTVLEAIDDAATANWGSEWRTPTLEEMEELIQYCTWTWTTLRGVNGQLAVGPNGNSIFLPAAGSRSRDYISYADSSGWYWTSSLHSTNIRANYVSFGSGTPDVGYTLRCSGHSVRPVQSPIRN